MTVLNWAARKLDLADDVVTRPAFRYTHDTESLREGQTVYVLDLKPMRVTGASSRSLGLEGKEDNTCQGWAGKGPRIVQDPSDLPLDYSKVVIRRPDRRYRWLSQESGLRHD